MKKLRVKSYAKINLALDILRKDRNYHRIETVFQQIPLFDELLFSINSQAKTDSLTIKFFGARIPKKNTIHQAVELLKKTSRKKFPALSIIVNKNIPVAAGLGGGSSNAATTLLALNKLLDLKLTTPQLQRIAEQIGMDVPFFLYGGTALGTHYGEKITPLPPLRFPPALIAINSKKESTGSVYSNLNYDLVGKGKKQTKDLLKKLKKPTTLLSLTGFFHNDFETVFAHSKSKNAVSIRKLQKKLLHTNATAVHICGSGPALCAFYASKKKRDEAYRELKKQKYLFFKSL